jgi:prepilin-type N-terminal cleavage/methylation domain-containing protein
MKQLFNRNLHNQRGFTLIELLIVIAIIGILAAIVLIGINPAQRLADAGKAAAKSDVGTVAQVVEVCITKETENGTALTTIYGLNSAAGTCSNRVYLTGGGGYARTISSDIRIQGNTATSQVCLYKTGTGFAIWYSTATGTVAEQAALTPVPAGCHATTPYAI